MVKQTIVEFDIQDLLPIGITIGVLGVALSYMASMETDIGKSLQTGTATATCNASLNRFTGCAGGAGNITANSLTGQQKLAQNIPMIAGAVVIAVIIGILMRYFVFNQGR